jgi:hypothetical protein
MKAIIVAADRAASYCYRTTSTFQELEGILEEEPETDEIDAVDTPPPVDILTDEEDLNDDGRTNSVRNCRNI